MHIRLLLHTQSWDLLFPWSCKSGWKSWGRVTSIGMCTFKIFKFRLGHKVCCEVTLTGLLLIPSVQFRHEVIITAVRVQCSEWHSNHILTLISSDVMVQIHIFHILICGKNTVKVFCLVLLTVMHYELTLYRINERKDAEKTTYLKPWTSLNLTFFIY